MGGVRQIAWGVAALLAAIAFFACTNVADGELVDEESSSSRSVLKKSSSSFMADSTLSDSSSVDTVGTSSSSVNSSSSENVDSLLSRYGKWVLIPAGSTNRGKILFSVDSFKIMSTEVTQSLYKQIMGTLPKMNRVGDSIPVANLNWYDAVLFCNEFSKKIGLDTAYIYESVGESRYLKNLKIDYGAGAVRLPTEMEWEVAYRAGTSTSYYWGADRADKYAYYAQSSGPVKVAQYIPNEFGLYDMGGNVAEWVNDWFGPRPTESQINYVGAREGSAKVLRGGGWSDVAKVMSADSTVKKDPLYQSEKLGLRLVYSR